MKHVVIHQIKHYFFPVLAVFAMLVIHVLVENGSLFSSYFALFPRSLHRLHGIVTSAWFHGDWEHLKNNIFSFLPLSILLFTMVRRRALLVWLSALVLSGVFAWIGARQVYHIGASGWIYALSFYLMAASLRSGGKAHYGLFLALIFFYGNMIWGVLPLPEEAHISWDGHLFGLFAGVFLSLIFPFSKPQTIEYSWMKEHAILESLKGKTVRYTEIITGNEQSSEDQEKK